MPGESLIVVDGFIRTLPDGSLVTDKDGAPCCCGGGGIGCCFCVDINAAPGESCHNPLVVVDPAGKAVPMTPEQMCIVAARCCSGSKVRLILTRRGHQESHTDYRPGGVNKFRDETNDITERAVVECEIVRDGDACSFKMTPLEYFYRLERTVQDEKGVYDIPPVERTELLYIPQRFNAALLDPFRMTRPEPLYLALKGLQLDRDADGGIWGATFSEENGKSSWYWHYWFNKCAGEDEKTDGDVTASESWASAAACRACTLTLSNRSDLVDQFHTDSRWMDSEASVVVEVIEDDCCPPPGIKRSAFPSGPVNPADPGTPSGLMYGCPACGAAFNGEKCYRCGYCQGCGG